MTSLAAKRGRPTLLVPALLAGMAIILILLAIAAFVQSARQFEAATSAHSWLHWADERRTIADRFRFALSTVDEVAVALAPAAIAGIDAVPLEMAANASVGDARGLIDTVNQINPPCALVSAALPACGEAAVTRRHNRLERVLTANPLGQDYWIERNALLLALRRLIAVSTEVCGLTPYRTETAFLVKPVDGYGTDGVTGWTSVAPGECRTVGFGKYRHLPKLFAHSRAADSLAVGLLRADLAYAAAWGDAPVAWGGRGRESVLACVPYARAGGVASERCGLLEAPLSFGAVQAAASDGAAKGVWLLADPGLCRPDCAWGESASRLPLASLKQHAAQLASLLPQRQQYRAAYGSAQPYVNGIAVSDDNGPYRAGVRVTAAIVQTPFGVESPFRTGDIITSLAGTPIFSDEDLRLALARFVTTIGADKAYSYQYWRYEPERGRAVKYEQSATVFFDPDYWLANGYADSEVRALLHGFFNALSFGWYRSVSCAFQRVFRVVPSYTACTIAAANEWMLMRQLYPRSYSWGALPAMIFSPIRFVLGAAGVAISAGAELVIEALEAGMGVVAELAPGQSLEISARQFAQSLVVGRLTHFGPALTRGPTNHL